MSDLQCTLAQLALHPVKSCAGLAVPEALVIETGLEFDRAWMVVQADGTPLTQREEPRMALVRPQLKSDEMVLRAPGMLALHVALDRVEGPAEASVWGDPVHAFDMGALAAQWFSDFLGRPLRMLRFDPSHKRLSSRRWTGDIEAENAFSDGFPLLVASTASLAELNHRLAARGVAPVGMERFRPNLVLDGLSPFDEDHIDTLTVHTDDGPVRLKLVKPCTRCSMPSVDPATGVQGTEPGDTLAGFRADPRVDGAITFAMNAVLLEGVDCRLAPGQRVDATFAFA